MSEGIEGQAAAQGGFPAPGDRQAVIDDLLVRRAWTWTAASLLVPLLMFWSLPNAALTVVCINRGDRSGAESSAGTCKSLGIAAVAIFVVFWILWIISVASLAATA